MTEMHDSGHIADPKHATSVARIPERCKHNMKQNRCYNTYIYQYKGFCPFLIFKILDN